MYPLCKFAFLAHTTELLAACQSNITEFLLAHGTSTFFTLPTILYSSYDTVIQQTLLLESRDVDTFRYWRLVKVHNNQVIDIGRFCHVLFRQVCQDASNQEF